MGDEYTLAFYKLCSSCNLNGLVENYGDIFDTSGIDMNYAYYLAYSKIYMDNSPIIVWLLALDPNIDIPRIKDYMADENIPNDALLLACKMGHIEVIKWLLEKELYLSGGKNRCHICNVFEISCEYRNLDITKIIFNLLPEYISERSLILNEAYNNAMYNKNIETIKWLKEIDEKKLIKINDIY